MNPLISKFISDTFYEGKISDAEKIMEFIGKPDLYQLRLFRPLVFLNVEVNQIPFYILSIVKMTLLKLFFIFQREMKFSKGLHIKTLKKQLQL